MNGLWVLGALFLEVEFFVFFFFPWDYLMDAKEIQKVEKNHDLKQLVHIALSQKFRYMDTPTRRHWWVPDKSTRHVSLKDFTYPKSP